MSIKLTPVADRKYAWAPVNTRSELTRLLKRSKRWNILPAYDIHGYFACRIKQGSFNTESFNDFVRHDVLPYCGRADLYQDRSVIVMDSASIHSNEELKQMCNDAGVLLEYLPPYSPDLNPIESSFSVLKARIRRHQDEAIAVAEQENGFGLFLERTIQSQKGVGIPKPCFQEQEY